MLKSTVSICLAAASALTCAVLAEEEKVEFAGKVLDESNHPVKHALVVITDRDTHVASQTHTDGKGRYGFLHVPASRCSVHVVPPGNSGLAQAFLPDVPAAEGRHVLLKVHKGFSVQGRVICDGKPMKGTRITVTPADGDARHDGGEAVTDWHGGFQIVLTPGEKKFEFSDNTHRSAPAFYQHNYAVTADSTMNDIVIPPAAISGINK